MKLTVPQETKKVLEAKGQHLGEWPPEVLDLTGGNVRVMQRFSRLHDVRS
jgi:hypothetical protein